jgi:dipeptide/tripeptide permease
MRSVGLAAILLSVLVFLFPWYGDWLPFISLSSKDTRIFGGLLLAVGAITLAIYRRA